LQSLSFCLTARAHRTKYPYLMRVRVETRPHLAIPLDWCNDSQCDIPKAMRSVELAASQCPLDADDNRMLDRAAQLVESDATQNTLRQSVTSRFGSMRFAKGRFSLMAGVFITLAGRRSLNIRMSIISKANDNSWFLHREKLLGKPVYTPSP
jgi:hypothetical protein